METKKLTAKDLMIGDLVCYCKENNYLTKVESIHNTGHASVSDEYCIKCFRDRKDPLYDKNPIDFFNVEILHPIPLTAEILEKNGFKYNDCPIVLGWEQYGLTLYRGGDGFLINCGQNVALIINYVHELQHALRLCRVDKEIVL